MEDTNLRAMLGGPAKLGLQPTLPWLTVNFRQNQNEGGSEADEDQNHKWCICDRNPSSCLIHAGSSTAHWSQSSEISLARPQFVADHFRDGEMDTAENSQIWKTAKMKADVLAHPLYQQLLAAHVACLRIATPVEQLPSIDAQLAQSQQVVAKYSPLADPSFGQPDQDKDERDQFMSHYVLLLCSFKEQLQQHVRVHAMEAVMACWELEQSFSALTGVSPGEGSGVTMSDDDDDLDEGGGGFYDPGFDLNDSGGFGPLIPTENERSLMERVRQELKSELKQGYKERIIDVRDEILRKRRAGKLPGDTTTTLKAWWEAHSKWPYPTEDEKSRLVHETGLQLKQINNWFINQRKRNWHNNSLASSKSKRKR